MKASQRLMLLLFAAGIVVNFNGLFIDILEPDGALYATISKHIALTGDWVNLWGDGHDWLDKPHLPFWLCAASFKVFGINSFAYKLPGFLCWLATIYYTFLLAKTFFNDQVGHIAAVLFVFSLHTTLNNFDVRAEPFLTLFIAASMYYFYRAAVTDAWRYVVLTAFTAALAIMTKGVFSFIIIAAGVVLWWIIARQWKQFLNVRWYVLLLMTGVFILPELYCLYMQFDIHPEKVVFGKTNVSGLRFFFWDSQFGRFFNTGPIKGSGEKTFFLHTTLWAYLPWSILLYCGVVQLIRKGKLSADKNAARWTIYGSTLIAFLLFSLSGFQLPHYISILFPQFSIIVAAYLLSLKKEATLIRLQWVQYVLLIIASFLICALAYYSRFGYSVALPIGIVLLLGAFLFFFRKNGVNRILATGALCMGLLFTYLFNFFYPSLLTYQSGMIAGRWMKEHKPNATPALFNALSYSFEFYAPGQVDYVTNEAQIDSFNRRHTAAIYFTTEPMVNTLTAAGRRITRIKSFPSFHISMLTLPFLNPATRSKESENMWLVEVK